VALSALQPHLDRGVVIVFKRPIIADIAAHLRKIVGHRQWMKLRTGLRRMTVDQLGILRDALCRIADEEAVGYYSYNFCRGCGNQTPVGKAFCRHCTKEGIG
jgi:hypothetical protein